jgi:hypothetical protein
MEGRMSVLDAQKYREEAEDARRRLNESWERSDTDGALSQWALANQESQALAWAQLAENDYLSTYEALAKDGKLVPHKEIQTKFGWCFAVFESFEEAKKPDGKILQFVGTGDKAVKNKGYEKIIVEAKSKVILAGKGWTLSPSVVPVEFVFTPDNCRIVN